MRWRIIILSISSPFFMRCFTSQIVKSSRINFHPVYSCEWYLQVIINKWKIIFFRFLDEILRVYLFNDSRWVCGKVERKKYWIVTITKLNTHPTNINKTKASPLSFRSLILSSQDENLDKKFFVWCFPLLRINFNYLLAWLRYFEQLKLIPGSVLCLLKIFHWMKRR